jgi:hypothetical protein
LIIQHKDTSFDHTFNSYVVYGFWKKYRFFSQNSESSGPTHGLGGFWGTNWNFIYKLNKIQVTRFVFLVSPYNEVLSVALLR